MTEVRIPKLGISMTEAILAEWLAVDGAEVAAGAPLYVIEMDKSTNEVEAAVAGRLSIRADAGETYPVGHLVAVIA